MTKMKEDSSREDEAAAKSGTFTSARLSTTPAGPYDPRAMASAEIPGKASVSIQPKRFFKSDRSRNPWQSRDFMPWHGKSQIRVKTNKESSKKAKVTKIKLPFSTDEVCLKSAKIKPPFVPKDDYEDFLSMPSLLKATKTKPPVSTPPIPVFNGNLSSPPFSSLASTSSLNGNISSDASKKKPPGGKSPDPSPPLQLIDLSGCDDQEPRSGFVSPHQVGFQVK